jgi:hypothetical protein
MNFFISCRLKKVTGAALSAALAPTLNALDWQFG